MNKLTARRKGEGELLVRRMSEKAQAYYNGADVDVYADDRSDNEGIDVQLAGEPAETMSFKSIEAWFEQAQDEVLALEAEDDED